MDKTVTQAIEELKKREEELTSELNSVRSAIRELELSSCPIKVGQVVLHRGREFRIIEIDRPEWQWVYANPRRSDGSWGTARRHLLGDISPVSNGESRDGS
jgi:hypothetical protein